MRHRKGHSGAHLLPDAKYVASFAAKITRLAQIAAANTDHRSACHWATGCYYGRPVNLEGYYGRPVNLEGRQLHFHLQQLPCLVTPCAHTLAGSGGTAMHARRLCVAWLEPVRSRLHRSLGKLTALERLARGTHVHTRCRTGGPQRTSSSAAAARRTHSDRVQLALVRLRLLLAGERQRRQRRRNGRTASHVRRVWPPEQAYSAASARVNSLRGSADEPARDHLRPCARLVPRSSPRHAEPKPRCSTGGGECRTCVDACRGACHGGGLAGQGARIAIAGICTPRTDPPARDQPMPGQAGGAACTTNLGIDVAYAHLQSGGPAPARALVTAASIAHDHLPVAPDTRLCIRVCMLQWHARTLRFFKQV